MLNQEAAYKEGLAITEILFERNNREDIVWAKHKLAAALANKDQLIAREKEFAQMSLQAIAKWRYETFGGRKDP